jgi:CBS domain-containing protein
MQARELMTKKPACCTPETSLPEVARMMVEHHCGEIPVVDSKESMRPIGVITDRDITCRSIAEGKNPLNMIAGECMSTPCVTISEDASIEDCCRVMEENLIRRVPVVDSKGRCCGIVSQADIAQTMDELAAEVVRQVSQPTEESSFVRRRERTR